MNKALLNLLAEAERSRVKRRLKRAFARKPKPAKVRIPDEDANAATETMKNRKTEGGAA